MVQRARVQTMTVDIQAVREQVVDDDDDGDDELQ
jgi:hypothetical protein